MNLLQYATLKVRAPETMKMLGAIAGRMSDLTQASNAHFKLLEKSEQDAEDKLESVVYLKAQLSTAETESRLAQSTMAEAESNFATVSGKQLEVSGMIHTLFEEISN